MTTIAFYISNDEETFGYMPAHSSWEEQDEITVDGKKCYIYALEKFNEKSMHKIITPIFNAAKRVNSGRARWAKNKIDLFCECVDFYIKEMERREQLHQAFISNK